jgi:hypothetical protein
MSKYMGKLSDHSPVTGQFAVLLTQTEPSGEMMLTFYAGVIPSHLNGPEDAIEYLLGY